MTVKSELNAVAADISVSVRALRRNPIYAITAIGTLAIGIGACTAAYSIVGAVLLKPLPFADPSRLVAVYSTAPGAVRLPPSYPDFADYRAHSDVFDGMAFVTGDHVLLRRSDGILPANAAMVTDDFFPLLGARPAVGRTFLRADTTTGATNEAVLSYGFWARSFGADLGIIGKQIDVVDLGSYTVVGVMAPGQSYPEWVPGIAPDLYVPLRTVAYKQSTLRARGNHADARTIARLAPGVTLQQARQRLGLVAHHIAAEFASTDQDFSATVVPLEREIVGDVRPALALFTATVVLVFLLACADVANLSLVRALSRVREFAVRAALGAGFQRIVRYLLTESALLALGGAAAGACLAILAVKVFVATSPGDLPRTAEMGVDGHVLLITVGVAVVAALACALAPLLSVRRGEVAPVLRSAVRGTNGSREGMRVRAAIVGVQFALAMTLVVGAALLIKSFVKLRDVNPGFDTSHLLVWGLPTPTNADASSRWALDQRALNAAVVPGVVSVSLVNHVPLTPAGLNTSVGVDGANPATDSIGAGYLTVAPRYFETMRIPLVEGRDFTDADMTPDAEVAIVSRAMAKQYWPAGTDAVGRQMTVLNGAPRDPDFGKPIHVRVIGLVGDVRRFTLDEPTADRLLYMPYTRPVWQAGNLVIRTAGSPEAMVPTIRRVLRPILPQLSSSALGSRQEEETEEQIVARGTARQRFNVSLVTAFASVALVLAIVGLSGVVSYSVAQRRTELGIRLALGARAGDVTGLVLKQATIILGAGFALGIGGGVLFGRAVRGLLFAVQPVDGLTLLQVGVLFTAVGMLASYLPARRVSRLDPSQALRAE